MNPLGQISAAESVVRSNPEGPRPESGACSEGNPVREKVLDLLTVLHVMYRSVTLPVIFAKWHLQFPGRYNFRPTSMPSRSARPFAARASLLVCPNPISPSSLVPACASLPHS